MGKGYQQGIKPSFALTIINVFIDKLVDTLIGYLPLKLDCINPRQCQADVANVF